MCRFLSFMVDRQGRVHALLGKKRAQAVLKGKNPDSHSYIAHVKGIDEDRTWKYELPMSIDQLRKAVEAGTVAELITLRNLKYDGGLPEEELKTTHENAIRSFLQEIDWEKDVLLPMESPEKFIIDRFSGVDFTQRRGMVLIERKDTPTVAQVLVRTHLSQVASEVRGICEDLARYDTKGNRAFPCCQLTWVVQPGTWRVLDVALAWSVAKYYDNKDDQIKTRLRIVISPFIDIRETKHA